MTAPFATRNAANTGASAPSGIKRLAAAGAALCGLFLLLAGEIHAADGAEKKEKPSTAGKPYNTSLVPKFTFAETLAEQEAQLKDNPLMLRFAESRKKLAADRYRPLFHFVSPEKKLHDPNGLCFWQGRWHLFYQAFPPEGGGIHWGHAISDDLIHWRDLPYAIYPGPEKACWSGSALVEDNRVIAMYHGVAAGIMVATSDDPLLLNWEKLKGKTGGAVIPPGPEYMISAPCIWRKGDAYYSLSGYIQPRTGERGEATPAGYLFRSKDLVHWEYLHQFIENDHATRFGEDLACPHLLPIGDRHIMLSASHLYGAQYRLGDYEKERDKFIVTAHDRFNTGALFPGGVHAPSATSDGRGGIVTIFNINDAKPIPEWIGIMSLPVRLTLLARNELGMEPAGDIESLRGERVSVAPMTMPANKEMVFENVRGNAMELNLEIDPKNAPMIELNVLRSQNKEEFTRIAFYGRRGPRDFMQYVGEDQKKKEDSMFSIITLDNSHSSELPDVLSRAPENAQFHLPPGETLKLRVFIDRSVVEVFANGRRYVALRVYPGRDDSLGVSLRAQGGDAELKSMEAWQMKSIYP
ncbi:MAG: glycosyl hydrolase family 32 domain protein [Verrucomicrobiaceae bacterium]|nr:MAG: glycosyl hydrolase family 32 domain protein [Verrucomicrobiaceae bacterium]